MRERLNSEIVYYKPLPTGRELSKITTKYKYDNFGSRRNKIKREKKEHIEGWQLQSC